jgi:hypothetical protein
MNVISRSSESFGLPHPEVSHVNHQAPKRNQPSFSIPTNNLSTDLQNNISADSARDESVAIIVQSAPSTSPSLDNAHSTSALSSLDDNAHGDSNTATEITSELTDVATTASRSHRKGYTKCNCS